MLILGVPLDLSPIGVHKASRVLQAPIEERLELVPGDRDTAVCILFLLELLLAEANPVPKEGSSKRNLVSAPSSSSRKVIFILLTKVVIFHVEFSAVHIRGTGFQELISSL